jgi:thiol:disulfide interchange protein DsbA
MRKLILSAVLAGASLLGILAPVHAAEFEAGKHYTELRNPVPVAVPGKIEVVEMFWYGCPHCYHLEPALREWSKKLPADVNFIHVPALFGNLWQIHGQLFLALESMGVESKVRTAVFEAIQKQGNRLKTPEEMAEFLAGHGVDKAKFLATYNSFAIKGQMQKAMKLGMAYQVTGVPALIVNGKYRLNVPSSEPEQLLKLADFLIEKERAAAAAASAAPAAPAASAR